jgi:hypothetical protein
VYQRVTYIGYLRLYGQRKSPHRAGTLPEEIFSGGRFQAVLHCGMSCPQNRVEVQRVAKLDGSGVQGGHPHSFIRGAMGADDGKIVERIRKLLYLFKTDDFQIQDRDPRLVTQKQAAQFNGALGNGYLGEMSVQVLG